MADPKWYTLPSHAVAPGGQGAKDESGLVWTTIPDRPSPTEIEHAKDTATFCERERCKRLLRRIIAEAQCGDWPAGPCCISRLNEALTAISDPDDDGR